MTKIRIYGKENHRNLGNSFLPVCQKFRELRLFTPVDKDLEIQAIAVGIDRNDAAKPTKRPGRRRRMSKPPFRR
jgi:hypothetical protein